MTLEDFLAARRAAADELAPLKQRERDVLVLVAKGYMAKEIARQLDMGQSTVSAHITRIRAAMQMTTTEAVVLAVKAGWV